MSYCEDCSTEYEDCKKYCKVCGSELIAIKHNDENLSSLIPVNQRSDYKQEHEIGNTFHFGATDTEKVADDITCGSREQLTSHPDFSSVAKINMCIPVFRSICNAITEGVHRVTVFSPLVFVILSILFISAGYWAYTQYLPVSTLSPNAKGPTAIREQQAVTIQSKLSNEVFDMIKKANLTKDISLFMSCYSPKFESLDSKKAIMLTNWKRCDYNDLNYNIKGLTIHKNKASGIIEWVFSAQCKDTRKIISTSVLYNVVLEKEKDGIWKIIFLKNI